MTKGNAITDPDNKLFFPSLPSSLFSSSLYLYFLFWSLRRMLLSLIRFDFLTSTSFNCNACIQGKTCQPYNFYKPKFSFPFRSLSLSFEFSPLSSTALSLFHFYRFIIQKRLNVMRNNYLFPNIFLHRKYFQLKNSIVKREALLIACPHRNSK